MQEIMRTSHLNMFYEYVVDKTINEADEMEALGTRWSFMRVNFLEIRVNKYDPLDASSYFDLPDEIKREQAIINVKNYDNKCFV